MPMGLVTSFKDKSMVSHLAKQEKFMDYIAWIIGDNLRACHKPL